MTFLLILPSSSFSPSLFTSTYALGTGVATWVSVMFHSVIECQFYCAINTVAFLFSICHSSLFYVFSVAIPFCHSFTTNPILLTALFMSLLNFDLIHVTFLSMCHGYSHICYFLHSGCQFAGALSDRVNGMVLIEGFGFWTQPMVRSLPCN